LRPGGRARDHRGVPGRRTWVVLLAALLCGAGSVALILASHRDDASLAWAIAGPLVGWLFIGTGRYATWRLPGNPSGTLMAALGFAWFLSALYFANGRLLFTAGLVLGGVWGGVFLQLVLAFPSGRLRDRLDVWLTTAGYLTFTGVAVPALLVASPEELVCEDCPANLLLIRSDESLADVLLVLQGVLYVVLFLVVAVRLVRRHHAAGPLERMRITPVYVSGMLTFGLVIVANAGGGDAAQWVALACTAALPAAFLAGLLRTHVARLDAELHQRLDELRASRARLVEAGDTARRRIERDLHDGAQARFAGLGLLLGRARRRAAADPELAALLDEALAELRAGLGELRELARGIHPPLLTEQGLGPALEALATRATIPVAVDARVGDRLPAPVEAAAYFVAAEALANVAKYAGASEAMIAARHTDGRLTVEVRDDGVGGADPANGSGLRGLADRVAALDGALAVESPPGRGTTLRAVIPATLPQVP
jgi:signal transduction histidine kinase